MSQIDDPGPIGPPGSGGPRAGYASDWDEMKAYTGFCEADAAALREILPLAEPELPRLVDRFYSTIARFPDAAAVLSGPAQVQRLKLSLQAFIRDMLTGPHDGAYYEKRRRIGHVHVRVGLPERYVFTAMSLIRDDLCALVQAGLPTAAAFTSCKALMRITDLELAVMSSTYLEAHEAHRLRSLQDLIIENMPVTVLCLDTAGRVTSATRPSARLFGQEIDRGRHFGDFLPGDLVDAADLHSHVGRALATNREITVPRVLLGDRGTERHYRVTLVPLEHETARLLMHIEELTDVVQAEQRLQHAEALARVGSLAAHLAHEIRNPLAAISATLQVIVGTLPDDDRRRTILGKVQGQVHRLDRLVSDLLGYARPTKAKLEVVDLAALAADAIRQADVPAELRVDGAPRASADPQYLCQVLVNLLQNARDALLEAGLDPAGRVRLRVGPGPELRVEDDGPGISEELRERLFEPFVTTKTKGTGLGLAISRKLVRGMEGELDLLPGGPGARFRVQLAGAGA
jgi:signal transduction histidine kinase